jgi:TPP-dependent pyruvate/acetoin dehydrogenase alpha subunit
VGLALADTMQQRPRVTACFFGDGAVAEGEFHESMNLAAVWRLPVLFLCENNHYAMGTALELTESQTNLALKAASYDMPAWSVDGMDVVAVEEEAERAALAIRGGGGPVFLECRTYRFRAHSMYDPDLYRDKAEVLEWKEHHDPIDLFAARLREHGMLDDETLATLEREIATELSAAVAFAEASEPEPPEQLTWNVYAGDDR